jgi:hypothetical protein
MNVNQLKQAVSWHTRQQSYWSIFSTWTELAAWYQRGLCQFYLYRLRQRPMPLGLALRIFIGSLKNVLTRSHYVLIPCAQAPRGPSVKSVIVTWTINETDTVEQALSRYLGTQALPSSDAPAETMLRILYSTIPLRSDRIQQLHAHGLVALVPKNPRWFLNMAQLFIGPFLFGRAAFCAEFWRARNVSNSIVSFIKQADLQSFELLMPYEQQAWQLLLISRLRPLFKEQLKVIGDVHSSISTFPSQWIRTAFSPDLILVHGTSYKRLLTDHMGWHESQVQITPTCRFSKKTGLSCHTFILPYDFISVESLISLVRVLLLNVKIGGAFEVKIHPAQLHCPKHQQLKSELTQVIESLRHCELTPPVAVIAGVTTALYEALENGITCYSLLEDVDVDLHDQDMWPEIKVRFITDQIVEYKLNTPGAFIIY